jgi:hypothetical protein
LAIAKSISTANVGSPIAKDDINEPEPEALETRNQ